MATTRDADALRKTTSLIDYLVELTDAANRNPVRDIESGAARAPEPVLWLDAFPDGITLDAEAEEVLLTMSPVPTAPPPPVPDELVGWVDPVQVRSFDGIEPRLRTSNDDPSGQRSREQSFGVWLPRWRQWAGQEPTRLERRAFYEQLEGVAKKIEQQDDQYEFVLAVGLVSWHEPGQEAIRRHLLTEQVVPRLDRTGTVTLTRIGGKRRMEDRQVFDAVPLYRAARGRAISADIVRADGSLLGQETADALASWLGLTLDSPYERWTTRPGVLPETPVFSVSPALLLRPRSKVQLAEAYRRIAEALRRPGAEVPVALTQIVVDTDREQRDEWLTRQGAASGDLLGNDPLFPLAANDEQSRVIDLLRTETGVVVQGPPGTGKTHTIANLISALLARGQRVLVTSQKDQALRVLRDKIPPELRTLCVLLAGGSKDAAVELEQGIDALSAAVASTDEGQLHKQVRALEEERDRLRAHSTVLNDRVRELRSVELVTHKSVVPKYDVEAYRGTLADIVREVRDHAAAHDWMPLLPSNPLVEDVPPLSAAEFGELRGLLAGRTPLRARRAEQNIPASDQLPTAADLDAALRAERDAEQNLTDSRLIRQLAELGPERLTELEFVAQHSWQITHKCGLTQQPLPEHRRWVERAVHDRLAGSNTGLWAQLFEVLGEPVRLEKALREQAIGVEVEFGEPITMQNLGVARGWLNTGRDLLGHLNAGGKVRRRLPSKQQRNAQELLDLARVDGAPPATAAQLEAALWRIEAEIAA
ncbi:AAA domain-containing protein [Pseudonocardia spinosispora]|uniref:AAA domain-containing protein n=1 Tax=Pseudonocardia spinosispora TaxID=103441 RepID=UPI00041F2FB2|nr:AAA domain-containing protein [Pseudonocardia spinosispora]